MLPVGSSHNNSRNTQLGLFGKNDLNLSVKLGRKVLLCDKTKVVLCLSDHHWLL